MSFSVKPNALTLIALWVPGFLTVAAVLLVAYLSGSLFLTRLIAAVPSVFLGFVIIIAGFAVGDLLDATRGLFELPLDRICDGKYKIRWDFFFNGDERHVGILDEWYYTYYEFDANMFLGIVVFYLLAWFRAFHVGMVTQLVAAVPALIFLFSAIFLRREMKRLIDDYYERTDGIRNG